MWRFGKAAGQMETERLLLRRWRTSDFQSFLAFACDPDVMPLSGVKPASDLAEAETAFHRALRDDKCFAIVLKETDTPIGKIRFQKDLRRWQMNSLSIGYELAKAYWGRGYMPEALNAMIRRAFLTEKADVLGISHFVGNYRSRRVIEKCGFRHEGTLRRAFRRYDGIVFDEECYSILREEYFEDRAGL